MPTGRRRAAVVVVLAVVLLGVGAVALRFGTRDVADAATATPTPSATRATPTASMTPDDDPAPRPTPSPTSSSAPTEEPTAEPTPSGDTRQDVAVSVTIAEWNAASGAVEVSGYADVVEDGGTCTLTITRDGRTVTGSEVAVADASTTSCGLMSAAPTTPSAGTWQAVLSYSSDASRGASAPVEVRVR
ncbi:MAG: hypothetical protein IR158_05435 [Cellulomonas sp.]|uniref:hypothetical protein n=1 Tax=Cellulomonas sp. TaxID=40001 RepID=UPI0019EF9A2A|nr:hypothetical protein [Cellulomonas sp.]MBF0687198.1 hypothetical protein [Cellulomonas sp.]